jgi:hypothetical protein
MRARFVVAAGAALVLAVGGGVDVQFPRSLLLPTAKSERQIDLRVVTFMDLGRQGPQEPLGADHPVPGVRRRGRQARLAAQGTAHPDRLPRDRRPGLRPQQPDQDFELTTRPPEAVHRTSEYS